ncbi:serine/threonine-protein kinase 1 [BeAn 58058 virus]|uniref:serine/threonine-protein kinase 1 n=1 Tax=BeAn 58058 virus TaxID=67082 RepID=UPI0009098C93|nr:serine/threonine-protein kinase 1 [BeAn 58058 virus]APG58359.1 serine/threonine-protein kinase 1 [BeAn 58058 virus]
MDVNITGMIINDTSKQQWIIGENIGKGGFGCIYTVFKKDDSEEDKTYVIKLEPKSNGPLLIEQVFYQRICKEQFLNKWKSINDISYLGIPKYHGFGFLKSNNIDYRFIIIDRLGCDLHNILSYNNNKLPKYTVWKIVRKVLDVLRYIHYNGYSHGDIKSENIALDYNDNNKIYLFDYGLSYRFMVNDKHVEYKPNPKKMHNGTLNFTSVDMHNGVSPSRRSDLETLGYCIVTWLGGTLPWIEDKTKNKKNVLQSKIAFLKSLELSLIKSLGNNYPIELLKYFTYVLTLKYDDIPDYNYLIDTFTSTCEKKVL